MSTKERLVIIQDTPSKYHFETKDDQRVDIEHKNDDYIYLSLYKWGEEASLQIVLDKVPVHNHTFLKNKIEVENPDLLLRVYPIDTRTTGDLYGDSEDVVQCLDGGVRFELVLKKKRPAMSNSFSFPLVAKNLRFSYQPFLTEKETAEGSIRPLNVEGSYAVYHVTKKDNPYMAGKAFHIYRPIAEDALGNKAWCSIQFDKYIDPTNMTIMIPQQFLDAATYPVTVDPDFGYTDTGGTWTVIGQAGKAPYSARNGSAWTMPAGGPFVANYIRAYVKVEITASADIKVFINQKDSGGAGTHGQIAVKENLDVGADAGHWEQFTLAGQALTSGINYILNAMAELVSVTYLAYDANGAIASYFETQTYATPESPWVVNPAGTTWDYSIYCNYSTGGAPAVGGLRMIPSLKGHMGYDLKTRGGKARRRVF